MAAILEKQPYRNVRRGADSALPGFLPLLEAAARRGKGNSQSEKVPSSPAERCVSIAKGRGPICGRPLSGKRVCGACAGRDRVACDHMSGLCSVADDRGQDGFRDARSKQEGGFNCHWVPRSVPRLGSIDHTNCSCSSKLLRLRWERMLPANCFKRSYVLLSLSGASRRSARR